MIELIQEYADDCEKSQKDDDYIYYSYFLKTKKYILKFVALVTLKINVYVIQDLKVLSM